MNYQLGTAADNMVRLETLGLEIPKAAPVDYPEYIDLGNGATKGVGSLQATWRFTYLTLTQLAILRSYCTGSSASVYIQTLAKGGSYTVYSGLMIWNEPEQPKGDMVLDFVLKFRNLVVV